MYTGNLEQREDCYACYCMGDTRLQRLSSDDELASLAARKRDIKEGQGWLDDKRKQVKVAKEQMKAAKDMAQFFRNALEVQRKEVAKLTPKENSDDSDHSDKSSSGYGSI